MRHNFTPRTKKAARERAGGACEAVGSVYGLPVGKRCLAPLGASGGEIDHYPLPAHAEGSDNLENAVVCCKSCHSYKTRNFDIPAEAKIKRIVRKAGPVELRRKTKKINSPGFDKTRSRKFNGTVERR